MTKDEQIDKLKRLCRFQFLTLGYYATEFNYDNKNTAYHPITGEITSGIMFDKGQQAKEAQKIAKELGFTGDEIRSWKGPKVD